MKKHLLLTLCLASSFLVHAQAPTWANDVAPIFYNNCTRCHNPSGIAPFSLMTYADAMQVTQSIRASVQSRTMPPWPPDPAYQRFTHERLLSAQEIQTIVTWVDSNSVSGNLSQAPTPPVYTGVSQMPNPDMVSQMPLYTVNASADLYRCFVMPSGLANDEFVTKVEVLPGNRNIVHHALIYQDVANTCVNLDNADPAPGYTSFGGVGSFTATLVFGWVPGQEMYELPPNMGIRLLANTNIIMQIHYPGGTFNQLDSTQVRFTFASGTVRDVTLNPVLNYWANLTNGPINIPPNTTRTYHAQQAVSSDVTLLTVAPHMHLIGRTIKSYAIDPNGDTIPFIDIPDWNFHWQGFYNFRQLIRVPAGSVVHADAFYDNTSNNPWNPSSPPQQVNAGEATNDEMLVVYFAYMPYLPGDENIIVDSSVLSGTEPPPAIISPVQTPQLYAPYPVPSQGTVNFTFFLPQGGRTTLEIVDAQGRTVATIAGGELRAGHHQFSYDVTALAKGTYFVQLTQNEVKRSKAFVH
ncbi:MAG: T9SS type A sorting domain-containing protein [Bacteroidia bacterium]|jgi:hypothetical protein|nr:T9SS type A sorting domain-containing protein [Bacteroidia bacterium]